MNLNPIHRRAALKQLGLSTLSLPILTQSSSLFGEPGEEINTQAKVDRDVQPQRYDTQSVLAGKRR